ncbi:hypothetical protein K1719_042828 [Acacia pycnantha]|nr:hypothetical protein K1719_042828 [Acacia pycnantha]
MTEKPTPLPLKPLSPLDWETLIDDFQCGGPRYRKWTSLYPLPSLLDLLLTALLRKDFPLSVKIQLLLFLEEFSDSFFDHEHQSHFLDRLIDTLRIVIQAPVDGVHITFTFKEQLMVSTTSILICLDAFDNFEARYTVRLVELLLTVINRPNHGLDRHTRAIACECLRESERANPCLLSEIVGHLWGLCQNERTHASQSYILLFTSVIHNIVAQKLNLSILNTSVPMVPFNVPQCMWDDGVHVNDIASSSGLGVATVNVEDAFDGQEGEICRRLLLISREAQHYLVFRLLAIQWLLGFSKLIFCKEVGKSRSVIRLCSTFYPNLFDPLALKALKLDLLAFCSICVDILRSEGSSHKEVDSVNPVQLFEDGLVCVSSFKWLPPGSTETAVMFRTLHKFVISASSHSDYDPSTTTYLLDSIIFCTLEGMLVNMMLDCWQLVPAVVAFVDRFLSCKKHSWLGERLLQKFDEHLLSKIVGAAHQFHVFPSGETRPKYRNEILVPWK